MIKSKDQGNSYYLMIGGMASIKTRTHRKLNYGQTVRIKNISGSIITVIPDNDNDPNNWAIIDAKELHNSEMPYT